MKVNKKNYIVELLLKNSYWRSLFILCFVRKKKKSNNNISKHFKNWLIITTGRWLCTSFINTGIISEIFELQGYDLLFKRDFKIFEKIWKCMNFHRDTRSCSFLDVCLHFHNCFFFQWICLEMVKNKLPMGLYLNWAGYC